ncbi:NADP-dependent oxidoreductase [Streptomyces sp. VRA16 Mangrove soil]|uniref:NADP-dependent oxidoreductase n=1 Tax=Streptomyces sp. VRA16 Mangrove soil TaxID=2817434 RepID=UPI001A9E331F|nr:NADP-dependent oxidoreductase [Streptomyces sp. VRA16 Mangrove soil]MBO1336332.1 NADP-dependent oxidoreductase [Streptomyces sp. VRA16 Mangrove soil]
MRVITQRRLGGPDVLEMVEVERPEPHEGEVLVRVHAAGVNPVDRLARTGEAPLFGDPPFTLGWDLSGVVESCGRDVTEFRPGDEVFGMIRGGAYAEYVAVRVEHLAPKPATIDHVHAAATPAAALTSWQALVDIGQIGPGRRVLVHAAAGGVGHIAVQIAKAEGAYVIGTARADKHAFLHDLGVDEPLDYTTTDFTRAVHDIDVALDLIGGDYGPRTLVTLRPGGLLVSAVLSDLGVTAQDAQARGVRFAPVAVQPSGATLRKVAALLAAGRIRPHVSARLPWEETGKAHEMGESGRTQGKIVLSVVADGE